MASFRKTIKRASHAIRGLVSHGIARHENNENGAIHSIGTERCYTQALSGVQKWLDAEKGGHVKDISADQAQRYLVDRAGHVSQKTLDLDRQAIQTVLGEKLQRVAASFSKGRLGVESRAYTSDQVEAIAEKQTERYSLATQIAYAAGLRAHELITIRPVEERSASTHREWSTNRFEGREGRLYTVVGKGGLVTEKMLPSELAEKLEVRRLDAPQNVRDRGVNYARHYDIAGGKKWSSDFSRASKQVLSFSSGGHGLRHSYAQERQSELQSRGYSIEEARGVVSQEMGHFSPDTTRSYER